MDGSGIFARRIDALDSVVQVGVAADKVIRVSFPAEPVPDASEAHEVLDRIEAALAGDDSLTDVPVGLTVTTDHRAVLDAVRQVPSGETATLEQVSRVANLDPEDPDDRELVRTALAENPVPLLMPDHRVEDVDGATPPAVAEGLRRLEA